MESSSRGKSSLSAMDLLMNRNAASPSSVDSESPQHQMVGKEVKQHLESMVRFLVDCVNSRTLSDNTHMFDDDFIAVAMPPQKLTLGEYLRHFQIVARYRPMARVDITGLSTVLHPQKGLARVFMNFDMYGVYEGVVRPSVAMMKAKQGQDGQWRFTRYEAADGVGGMDPAPV